MRAVDTNILVRVLARDNIPQAMLADQIMRSPTFVPVSAMVELESVLRRGYRWSRAEIGDGLRAISELAGASLQFAEQIEWALDRHGEGADFADALNVALSSGCVDFVTFDRDLGRRLVPTAPLPITVL